MWPAEFASRTFSAATVPGLTEHAARLWSEHGDHGYSLVVGSTHDGALITEAHDVTEALRHGS